MRLGHEGGPGAGCRLGDPGAPRAAPAGRGGLGRSRQQRRQIAALAIRHAEGCSGLPARYPPIAAGPSPDSLSGLKRPGHDPATDQLDRDRIEAHILPATRRPRSTARRRSPGESSPRLRAHRRRHDMVPACISCGGHASGVPSRSDPGGRKNRAPGACAVRRTSPVGHAARTARGPCRNVARGNPIGPHGGFEPLAISDGASCIPFLLFVRCG